MPTNDTSGEAPKVDACMIGACSHGRCFAEREAQRGSFAGLTMSHIVYHDKPLSERMEQRGTAELKDSDGGSEPRERGERKSNGGEWADAPRATVATLSDHSLQSFRSFGRKLGDDYVSVDDVRLCGDDFKIAIAEIERLRVSNERLWDNVAHLAAHHANEHKNCDHSVDGKDHG